VWLWKRLQEALKRALLVGNTLRGAIPHLCGEVQPRPLQIGASRIIETSVVAEAKKEMKIFRTGDLVRTIGHWDGWVTLGIAYSYEDWLEASKEQDSEHNRRYVYIQTISGKQIEKHPESGYELGGFYPDSLETISTTE
jgi:hypothetical protein